MNPISPRARALRKTVLPTPVGIAGPFWALRRVCGAFHEQEWSHMMRKEMYVALAAMLVGCGGGGSASTDSTADDAATPTSLGQYAGTYHCAATSASDEVFVAVLPTPTGAFSSCSGSVDSGTESITCTGSISATGNFVANKVDVNGYVSTNTGTVSGSAVTGTFSVPAVGVSGATFACKHTG